MSNSDVYLGRVHTALFHHITQLITFHYVKNNYKLINSLFYILKSEEFQETSAGPLLKRTTLTTT